MQTQTIKTNKNGLLPLTNKDILQFGLSCQKLSLGKTLTVKPAKKVKTPAKAQEKAIKIPPPLTDSPIKTVVNVPYLNRPQTEPSSPIQIPDRGYRPKPAKAQIKEPPPIETSARKKEIEKVESKKSPPPVPESPQDEYYDLAHNLNLGQPVKVQEAALIYPLLTFGFSTLYWGFKSTKEIFYHSKSDAQKKWTPLFFVFGLFIPGLHIFFAYILANKLSSQLQAYPACSQHPLEKACPSLLFRGI